MSLKPLALAAALLAGVRPLAAQQPQARPPLWLVAKADTVLIYLMETPPSGGFVVYRTGPGGAPEKRTPNPVVRVREPAVAAGQLGADLPVVMRAVRAVEAGEMYRRLVGDPFAAGVLSGLSRNVALVLGRLYVDTGVTRGATYQYRLAFTDITGKETNRSLTGQVQVTDVPPVAPTQVKVAVGDREARVSWTYPAYRGAAEDLVLGFHVYRAEGAGAFQRVTEMPMIRNDASAPEFRDSEARNGTTYRYRVTALDVAGRESAPSAPVSALVKDLTPPENPADLAVDEGNGRIQLTWRMSPETDVAGYNVERSTGLGEKYQRLNRALIPVDRPSWVDTVVASRRYFYRVVAVDASGNASAPSNSISALAKDTVPPDAPQRVIITATARRLTIKWAASKSPGLRGYFIYRGDSPKNLVRVVSAPITETQYIDSGYASKGLRPGGKYVIEVSAVDSSFNESPRTRADFAVADDEPPNPPTAFSAQNVRGRYVEIGWSASSSLDVQTYELARAVGDSALRVIGKFPVTARSARDTAVTHGRSYRYRLIAIDSAGNRSTPVIDSVQFRDFTAPPPPRLVVARVAPAGVTVTWERVVASELVGYNVYRSSMPTGIFERLTTSPVRTLTFEDRTGKKGLFYLVRAIDRSGNESTKSPVAEVIP
jgi:fibronectin type 3 domain-containing protein